MQKSTCLRIGNNLLLVIILSIVACEDKTLKEISVDFSASQITTLVGNQIQFKDLSDGSPSSWEWEFEGGNPAVSTVQNPIVVYTSNGKFKVTLKASNPKKSDIKTKADYINVLPPIEAAFIASSVSINQGSTASFNDNSSGYPTSWSWTFQGGSPSTSTEQNPVVTFTMYGRQLVSLTASNGVSSKTITKTMLVMPTNDLVTYFPFKGNSNDLSGRNNHGVVTGASLTNDRLNRPNEAYSFDGLDDQIVVPYLQEFENLPISLSFWINFSELKPSILGTDNYDYYQSGIWFSIGQSTETLGKLAISFGNGETPPGPSSRRTFVADNILITEKWFHVVGIVGNTGSLKIYLNGILASGVYTGLSTSFVHTKHSGAIGRTWDPTSYFKGKIDDLRIFNRILQEDEVTLLFEEQQ